MLQEEIERECKRYGRKLAIYLKANLEEALINGAKRGHSNPQEAQLNFKEEIIATSTGVKIQIIASGDYWKNIEDGRKPGKRMPPPSVVGKKWQNKHAINAKKVYLEIEARYKQRTGLSTVKGVLSRTKKKLSYEEYAKRLSFIFARAIARDGIPAKPFVKKAIMDSNLEQFYKDMSDSLGKKIRLDLGVNNRFTKITF